MSDKFQRYVWVNAERKRTANREKTVIRKSVFDAKNETRSIPEDPPKPPTVFWPGQFEEQLGKVKHRPGLQKRISKDSLYIRTPDTISIAEDEVYRENLDIEPMSDSESDNTYEQVEPEKPSVNRKLSDTPVPDYSHLTDYYLDPPIPVNHSDSTPFFLVTTNVRKI